MKSGSAVFLMYHELELPGRDLCQSDPGYVRYVLKASDFSAQMHSLHSAGWYGSSVSEALSFPEKSQVAITFDDGSETDLLSAAPVLKELGFNATFYITAAFLGKRGYLSSQQVRELASAGFEIGCHSKTHAYLSDLAESALETEIAEPKKFLEDLLSRPVEHFSCPGGRYNNKVQAVARRAGYRSLATSRTHPNSRSTDQFELGRVAILRTTAPTSFDNICRAQGLWRLRSAEVASGTVKSILGNSAYDALRARLLGRSKLAAK